MSSFQSTMDELGEQKYQYDRPRGRGYGDVPYRPKKKKPPVLVPLRVPQWVKDMRAGKQLLED